MARSLSTLSIGKLVSEIAKKNGEVKLCFCSIFLFYLSKGIPTRSLDTTITKMLFFGMVRDVHHTHTDHQHDFLDILS